MTGKPRPVLTASPESKQTVIHLAVRDLIFLNLGFFKLLPPKNGYNQQIPR